MGKFEELRVWQKAVDLAVKVYEICEKEPLNKNFGLKDQLQRSAVSISSNIAEGDEMDTQKQSVKFFYYSRGSSAELLTQSIISKRSRMMIPEDADYIVEECRAISRMINKLIAVRSVNTIAKQNI